MGNAIAWPREKLSCAWIGAAIVAVLLLLSLQSVPAVAASRSCLPGSLKQTLAQVEKRFGKVTVISTFRKGARVAGSGQRSRHASCRAVDFHPARGRYKAVLAWLRKNHAGGLGTYSGQLHHIHIDDGPKVRFHHHSGGSRKKKRR